MGGPSRDQRIVAELFGEIDKKRCMYDENGNLIGLNLSESKLRELPVEIEQLVNLRELNLSGNQLQGLPLEIGQLTNLQGLNLNGNQLQGLPLEIGQLTNLQGLNLSGNQLQGLPLEIGQLTNLQGLNLNGNQLQELPLEIGQLASLEWLNLNGNQLQGLPVEIGQSTNLQELYLDENQLRELPLGIGQLTNLRRLDLNGNQLQELPLGIGQLTNLRRLDLNGNQLQGLPVEIGQLTHLQGLNLNGNQLQGLLLGIGQLANLQWLDLSGNQLQELPLEIGQLTNLQWLDLSGNQLQELPLEIGQLASLEWLNLSGNDLRALPFELGKLDNLFRLDVDDNPRLLTPPPEIVELGTRKIKQFLQELAYDRVTRYESKLLIVGDGAVGKSSLLRLLRGDTFDPHLATSHGVEVGHLRLLHPHSADCEMVLNTWDFGGQQIYHATHQFFLTKRSIYLVVWSARSGAEHGRLNFWLDTIQALAPDSPVLLVTTHVDERAPNLNDQLYKQAYPQIIGRFNVSNKDGSGLTELREALIQHAASLPLMGQPWLRKWVEAEQALAQQEEHHIEAKKYIESCARHEVEHSIAKGSLGSYLHDLGKILYFRDDYVLSNLVVLKPNWVTKAISYVLEDRATEMAGGVLTHADLPRIWAKDELGKPYDPALYPIFLRLMERFDLSYQLESEQPGQAITRSLIPQLLPHQPPADLPDWPEAPNTGQMQVEMRYVFDFVPAGIMSWFIARTHRYTRRQHWREGAILEYRGHYARVELNPIQRELRLVVWGVQPHTFFTILKDTLDLILERFEGLRVLRKVPCICHWKNSGKQPCTEMFRYEEDLLHRYEKNKKTIECPASFEDVSVLQLLYGIHESTDTQMIAEIAHGQKEVSKQLTTLQYNSELVLQGQQQLMERLQHQSEWIERNFLRQWNLEMQKIEAECPGTFLLAPKTMKFFNPKRWIGSTYRLTLMCQHPPGVHCVGEGYELRMPKEWWVNVAPWLKHLLTFFKYAVPLGHDIGAMIDSKVITDIEAQITLFETIITDMNDVEFADERAEVEQRDHDRATGAALRALHTFLDKADASHHWSGLQKVITPEGNIFWLCAEHRATYEAKPLQLPV